MSEKCQGQTIFSTSKIRWDKVKANLTVRQLINDLLQLKTDVVDNRNISDCYTGRKGLHLNFSRAIQLDRNFANFIKKL